MTKKYKYTVIIEPQEPTGYFVRVPALPGCLTEGKTVEEALDNAREAISLYLETLEDEKLDIPEEKDPIITGVELRRKVSV